MEVTGDGRTSPIFTPLQPPQVIEWQGQTFDLRFDGGGMMMLIEDDEGNVFAPFRQDVKVVQTSA